VSSRHFGTNRCSLIIEITATPTKQTAGTRANRYNLSLFTGASLPLFAGHESPITSHKLHFLLGEEKSNRNNPTFKNRCNLMNPNDITFSNRNKNTLSGSPSFRHPSSLSGDKLRNVPGNPKYSGGADRKAHQVAKAGVMAKKELAAISGQVEALKKQLQKTTKKLKKALA
jgi:hypothetical protein